MNIPNYTPTKEELLHMMRGFKIYMKKAPLDIQKTRNFMTQKKQFDCNIKKLEEVIKKKK